MSGPVEGKIIATGISGRNNYVKVMGNFNVIGHETNENKLFSIPPRETSIWFEVRKPVESFTGRRKEIQNLHKKVQRNLGKNEHKLTVISQMTSISGLGGIGKSEIARMYAREHGPKYDGNVIWINAETYDTLTDSFYRLAKDKLNISTKSIDGQEKDIHSIIDELYKYFTKRKSLFIFDNAEKLRTETTKDEGIDKFLPKNLSIDDNEPYIIITSRNKKWGDKIKVLSIDTFSEEEAIEFIKKELHIIDESQGKEICKLAQTLQYFPLALQQAVSYIKHTDEILKNVRKKFEITDYLKSYEEKARELLDFDYPEDSSSYFKTTFITWKVTLEKMKQKQYGQQALEVLETIAFFAPDNIPTNIFLKLVNGDTEKMASMLQLPKQYSMVNLEEGVLNIHRLVQQVIRLKLKEQQKEKETLRRALILIKTRIEKADADCSKILPHAISAWNYSNNDEIGILTKELIEFSNRITYKLIDDRRYQEAYTFAIQTLELLKGRPKKGLLSNSNAEYNMALVMGNQSAHEILQEVSKLTEYELGAEHPSTLLTKHNIATELLLLQSKYDRALNAFQEVFKIQERVLGREHLDTLETRNSLAVVLSYQEKYDEALGIYQDVLEIRERVLGGEHPNTLTTRNNIAFVLDKQSKYDEALVIYQDILSIQERVLGEQHPDTLRTRHNIAFVLDKQDKYEEALVIYQDVLNLRELILGGEHPDTLRTRHKIAFVLDKQGKNDEALGIYQNVLNLQERVLGGEHPNTLATRHSIAIFLGKQGQFEEALGIYQDNLNIQERVLDHQHPDTLRTMHAMVFLLDKQAKSGIITSKYLNNNVEQ